MRDSIRDHRDSVPEGDTWNCPLAPSYAQAHAHPHIQNVRMHHTFQKSGPAWCAWSLKQTWYVLYTSQPQFNHAKLRFMNQKLWKVYVFNSHDANLKSTLLEPLGYTRSNWGFERWPQSEAKTVLIHFRVHSPMRGSPTMHAESSNQIVSALSHLSRVTTAIEVQTLKLNDSLIPL